MAEAILQRLRELVEEYNLRDPRKLLQVAQRQGVASTAALAIQALASDVRGVRDGKSDAFMHVTMGFEPR